MGQQVSAVVDSFDDDAKKENLAEDSLNAMVELAKTQVDAFPPWHKVP
jgi:hypothetical protein